MSVPESSTGNAVAQTLGRREVRAAHDAVKAAIGKVVETEQAPSEPAPPAEPPHPSA